MSVASENRGSVETMAFAASGGTPWHRFGNPVADTLTWQEMLVAAGLDWTVSVQPMYIRFSRNAGLLDAFGQPIVRQETKVLENGSIRDATESERQEIATRESESAAAGQELVASAAEVELRRVQDTYAITRDSDGSILGLCGEDWKPVQNWEVMHMLHDLLAEHGIQFETAGSLDDGQRMWALAKLPKELDIGGDHHRAYILAVNPHQAGKSLAFALTNVRAVCTNTVAHALADKDSTIRMVHRSEFGKYRNNIKHVLGLAYEGFDNYGKVYETLMGTGIDRDNTIRLMAPILQPEKKTDKVSSAPEDLVKRPENLNRLMTDLMSNIDYAPGGAHSYSRVGKWTCGDVFNGLTYCTSHKWGRSDQRRAFEGAFGKYAEDTSAATKVLLGYIDTQRAADLAQGVDDGKATALVGQLLPPPKGKRGRPSANA